jgi:DNA-directed RNA polymerase subunit RPC12/RpoP
MYKCVDCGRVFEESEFLAWVEPHGETMIGCPNCRGDFDEAFKCELCGEVYSASELIEGVCDSCINEYKHDHEMCFKVGECGKDAVLINSFIAQMFDADEIAEVMFKYLKETRLILGGKIDCSKFILSDKHFFAENLVEEVKRNESEKKQSR